MAAARGDAPGTRRGQKAATDTPKDATPTADPTPSASIGDVSHVHEATARGHAGLAPDER